MKKREIKKNIENNTLKLVVTEETKDNIYDSLPNIIKVCNKKYMIDLFYNNEKVDIDYITKNKITDNKLIDIVETVHAINLKDIKEFYLSLTGRQIICFPSVFCSGGYPRLPHRRQKEE